MKIFSILACAAIFCSCQNETTAENNDQIIMGDFEKHLAENTEDLNAWISEIESISGLSIEQNTFDTTLSFDYNFSPVKGTHSGNASVNEDFNSIYLSTIAFGEELPIGMKKNFFQCDIFDIISKFIDGEEIGYINGIPNQKDERFPSAAIAYIDAISSAEFVFLVDIKSFKRGQVSAGSGSMTAGEMKIDMLIYNMKLKKLLSRTEHQIVGPDVISYMSDQGKSFNEQQDEAEFYLDEQNEEHYAKAILNLFCKNHNFYN